MNTTITKLVMQGFKSFNKKISLPLLPGFNVICGPNGAGKSNVLDAIAFVLGRASAKSLRADRLHELIFTGGTSKSPAEYAAVTMYLDNTNKVFPFEFPEISVTRKVNRKGVSIYKINGKTTTREKILELLSSVRIHSDGHNIVLQGDVTQVIDMNPIERRSIIDEISGISEYNDKKNKAQKDLDAVDSKLKEAEIVITERYDIYKKLEDERNAALKYQQLQQQLVVLKASLAHRKFENFQENMKTYDEELVKKEVENEKLQKEIERIEAELEKRERGIQSLAEKLIKVSKNVEIEKEISYLRTKLMIDKDKIESNRKEIERLDSLIRRLEEIESRKEDIGELPRAVKIILEMKMKGVIGTVRSLIQVPEKYQIAVEIAAGHHLNDIVVENDGIASEAIEFLKREKIGRATFLPLNKINYRTLDDRSVIGKEGVHGIASNLIKFDRKHLEAVEFVFGNTVIVEDLEVARRIGIGKVRMVTLDGDLAERTGAMIGGYLIRSHPQLMEKMNKDEITEYNQLKQKLSDDIKKFSEEIQAADKKLKEYSEKEETRELIDVGKLKIDTEEELDKLRQERKTAYENRLMVQTDLNKIKIQNAKIEAEFDNVKIEVEQYGDVKYLDQGVKTLENGINIAMRELSTIGPVNFKAIEQYESFAKEFDEYKRKYERILEEKKAVLEMMEKIESKRKEVFYKALQDMSVKFDKVYKKMTGGTGSLQLENPNDLESGLLIQANPGGKRLLNIDSMSGGEKTLVALSFLFSVQEFRPSPFYILDEIDAALDKENSKKVAELIKSLSDDAQFIVITHNDTTIKQGDTIYGITMESGESKILALELPKE